MLTNDIAVDVDIGGRPSENSKSMIRGFWCLCERSARDTFGFSILVFYIKICYGTK